MQKFYFLLVLTVAVLLCGCNKQEKINSQKIDLLSQKLVQMDQSQQKQMALLQAQLTLLAPQLDKMNSSYFEKNRDDALFFHTNTLYLLLTIGQQIEAQLQNADAERGAQNTQIYNYHTNEMGMAFLCAEQIQAALTAQGSRSEENINAETKQLTDALKDALSKEIVAAAAPDPTATAWRTQIQAQITQIQASLDAIKAQLPASSPPAPAAH